MVKLKFAPRLAAVVGWPIDHSLSPLIHRTWAEREGANAYYVPVAVEDNEAAFRRAMDALAKLGFAGANVTLPHKENALRFCAAASEAATRAGAANMVTFTDDGPHADNSDIDGFAHALTNALIPDGPRGRALVLGAGGAAGGVVLGLQKLGFREIVISNRTRARAAALAKRLKAGARVVDWEDRWTSLGGADVLVNTTSLGMTGQPPLDLAAAQLPAGAIVCDIVYSPLETPLLRAAKERGCKTVDGLSMLMHQAVPGYLAWLGETAIVDQDLRDRLAAALDRKARS